MLPISFKRIPTNPLSKAAFHGVSGLGGGGEGGERGRVERGRGERGRGESGEGRGERWG